MKNTKILYSVIVVLLVVSGVMVGIIWSKSDSKKQTVTSENIVNDNEATKETKKEKVTNKDIQIVVDRTKEYMDKFIYEENKPITNENINEFYKDVLIKRINEENLQSDDRDKISFLTTGRDQLFGIVGKYYILDKDTQIDQEQSTITTYIKYDEFQDGTAYQYIDREFWLEWTKENGKWRINSSSRWKTGLNSQYIRGVEPKSNNKRNVNEEGKMINKAEQTKNQ
ncbi:hypothetical protein BK704_11700 [[Bacillus thuringiensis] serovar konkukian]|nr:hypothetical protein [Bacillus thuringiensis]MED1303815.1 hypothetical protein [Bacillus pacificus]OUB10727.1 hypothetical protein BK704_11700 [[Bacillus thuringiensis] serovar konkukian]